jgi:chemotaxis signal transduction protein
LSGTSGRYLRGVATIGERMILILDVTELLNTDELATTGAGNRAPSSQEK